MKQSIRNNSFSLGTWVSTGSPVVAELAGSYPFDWLLLDFEHGASHEASLPDMLRALARTEASIIVRVPEFQPALISRALDWGADGIMLPHVRSAEEAANCVAAMYYPPDGIRGYSSSVRAYGYGTKVPSDLSSIRPLLFAQIEDLAGVNHADEIAAVKGVDVLFVGPADLKLALANEENPENLTFNDALESVLHAAQSNGKRAGILSRDIGTFFELKKLGFSHIALDSDIAILRAGYDRIIQISQLNPVTET